MNSLEDTLKLKEEEFEKRCRRCGACCGAYDGDRCIHLNAGADSRYYCDAYDRRLGLQKTVSGKSFECVSIKEILRKAYPREGCGYEKFSESSI